MKTYTAHLIVPKYFLNVLTAREYVFHHVAACLLSELVRIVGRVGVNPSSSGHDHPSSPFAMYPGAGVNAQVNIHGCAKQLHKMQVNLKPLRQFAIN